MGTVYSLVNELLYALYGFIAAASAVSVLSMNRAAERNRVAAALMACYGLWSVSFGLQNAAVTPRMYVLCDEAFELCCFFLPALFLHFHLCLYAPRRTRGRLGITALLYAPALAFTALLGSRGALTMVNPRFTDQGVWYIDRPVGSPAFILLWVSIALYFALGYVLLILWRRSAREPLERKAGSVYLRTTLLLFAASLLLVPTFFLFDDARWTPVLDAVYGHGTYVLILAWLMSIRWCLRRYKVIDLRAGEGFSRLLTSLRAPVALVGREGETVFLNPAAAALLGEARIGTPLASLFRAPAPVADGLERMRRGEAERFEACGALAAGEGRDVRIGVDAIIDEQGVWRGALCTIGAREGAAGGAALEASGISRRETEVLLFLERGFTAREIAEELCLSLHTVKNHIHNIYEKTGARNRVELVKLVAGGAGQGSDAA